MAAQTPRVMYIAIDACDAGIIERLAASGDCPNIARLLVDGASVDTVAPFGTFVGSSWMTITTGREPWNHRYWNWLEVDPQTYELRGTTPRDAVGVPFWQQLSDAGRRVAVLDVPHMAIPVALNGVALKEWGCHDRHDGTASYPPGLLAELDRTIGRHPVGCRDHPQGHDAFAACDYTLRDGFVRTIDEECELLDLLRAGVEAKRAASLHVLRSEPWDLFATVLGEAHCVGHQFWHVHDERHPRHDADARGRLGDPVVEIYQRVDDVVGDLLRGAGPSTTVFLQLNHGMGPHFDGDHLLDQVLWRIDESLRGQWTPGSRSRIADGVLRRAPSAALPALRRGAAAAARWRARRGASVPIDRVGPHPDRKFFQVPGNTAVGAIRFNLIGRESHGLVGSGKEFDELCADVEAALLEVVDIDAGRPFVRRVRRSSEVLGRSPDDRLPDLFVEWDRASQVERVWSPRIGVVAAPYAHWRTGDHHDRGLLVVRGPGVVPGRRSEPMDLVDSAPTVAAALGVDLADVDGQPRLDLLGAIPELVATDREAAALRTRVAALEEHVTGLAHQAARSERDRTIWATMHFLASEPVDDEFRMSVVVPTYGRPERLEAAIASVVAQRHRNWEMIVVDDGSDTAGDVVSGVRDDRIRLVNAPHRGACHARNVALDMVTGDAVVYLDDDNQFDSGWLHAVAWAFRTHPNSSVLYGARIIDDVDRVHGRAAGGFPWLQFEPFDRRRLEQDNFADMGVIAHRKGSPVRFDTTLVECGDWDFFLGLTTDEVPLELPAIAFYYRTDGEDRLTGQRPTDAEIVRDKWRRKSGDTRTGRG